MCTHVCGTIVPLERIISKAGCITDCHRARLTSENVDKLVFVANNVWFFEVYEKECGKLVKTVTGLEKVLQNAT